MVDLIITGDALCSHPPSSHYYYHCLVRSTEYTRWVFCASILFFWSEYQPLEQLPLVLLFHLCPVASVETKKSATSEVLGSRLTQILNP